MPSPLRLLFPERFVLLTTRTEEGLPFVPTPFMKAITWSALGRAQHLYPVTVVGLTIMGNHFHFGLVVKNPDDIANFMDRVKTETSHAVNLLLGRKRKTIWQAGYDSPTVLTLDDALNKLVYIYTNPQEANLVETIDDYPGISSWGMFLSGVLTKRCKWIHRPQIPTLETTVMSGKEQQRLADKLLLDAKQEHLFTLSPDAWLGCYGITDEPTKASYRSKLINAVRRREKELKDLRTKEQRTVMGPGALKSQPMDVAYTPKKFSRRMWCICRDKETRIAFIQRVKELIAEGRHILSQWRLGDTRLRFPAGLFPPSMPRLCNLLRFEFA